MKWKIPKQTLALLILLCLVTFAQNAFANQYDDEEKLRRYLEREKMKDDAEREAAKQRADAEERANSSSGESDGGYACFVIVVAVAGYYWASRKRV